MRLGDIIASLRRKKRISSKDFSNRIGINPSLFSKIENNKIIPSEKVLKLIAENLNTSAAVLYLTVLEDKHFSDPEGRKLFAQLEPVVEDLLAVINNLSVDSKKVST